MNSFAYLDLSSTLLIASIGSEIDLQPLKLTAEYCPSVVSLYNANLLTGALVSHQVGYGDC